MKLKRKLLSLLLAIVIAMSAAMPCAAASNRQPRVLEVAARVLGNTLGQFLTGSASSEEIARLFASLPVLPDEDDILNLWEALRAVWARGVLNATVALRETAEEGVYQLGLLYNDLLRREKQVFDFLGTIEYNAVTGFFKGENGRGVFGIGFDYDSLQYMVRSSAQSWLKALGYNKLYDALAPLLGVMIDTLRFPFTYEGRDWMVQLWKGTYFAFFDGAEIGLYSKPQGRRVDHYDSSELALPLSLEVYNGDTLLFSTGEHESWWMAGFQYGNPLVNIFPAGKLRVEGSMRFPDRGMLEAFYAVFEKLKPASITGGIDGMTFNFVWRETNR